MAKAERMNEWQRLPLDTEQDRDTWFREKLKLGMEHLNEDLGPTVPGSVSYEPNMRSPALGEQWYGLIVGGGIGAEPAQRSWAHSPLQLRQEDRFSEPIVAAALAPTTAQPSAMPVTQTGESSAASKLVGSHRRKFF